MLVGVAVTTITCPSAGTKLALVGASGAPAPPHPDRIRTEIEGERSNLKLNLFISIGLLA
jgi:hypothetical protein